MAFHDASGAASLRNADHVDGIPRLQHVGDADVLPDLHGRIGSERELAELAESALPGLGEMTLRRLAEPLRLLGTEPDLDRGIAITGDRLLLYDGARPRLDDGDWHEVPLAREHLRHPDLLADYSTEHLQGPPLGFASRWASVRAVNPRTSNPRPSCIRRTHH